MFWMESTKGISVKYGTIFIMMLYVAGCQTTKSSDPTTDSLQSKHDVLEEGSARSVLRDDSGLVMSWTVNQDARALEVVLRNTTTQNVDVRAASHFEAEIFVISDDGKRRKYYEREFCGLMLTSTWLVFPRTLSPDETFMWSIAFEDLLPFPGVYDETPFATAIESGEVRIEEFWGFRD